jgi:hypothetical protein
MTTDARSFDVYLRDLRRFAQELQAQAEGLEARRGDLDTVGSLSNHQGVLGDFGEADALADVHARALKQVRALYTEVHEMIGFADAVARDVADRYQQYDGVAGDGYFGLGTNSSSSLGG